MIVAVRNDRWTSMTILELFPELDDTRIELEHMAGRGIHNPVDELAYLALITKALHPKAIFEIGTFRGRTALNFALNCPEDCPVYTIDLPPEGRDDLTSGLGAADRGIVQASETGVDYRGKDVMLVFWATWCRPCIVEIPHVIAFQNVVGKEKLAVLGISYISPINSEQKIRSFVAQNERINYAVFAVDERAMPEPYNMIQGIPSSFFIDPEGKIKLATSGLLSLGYMKAILQAE